jgi:uncharacterized protein (TIRG00374 family)
MKLQDEAASAVDVPRQMARYDSIDVMRYSSTVSVAMLAGFIGWCVLSLRTDLAKMSLAPLWHSWDAVGIAMMLTMSNYALRAVRWRWYLRRLGHALTLNFSTLTYIAGFAFTLFPGKFGELVRARYYMDMGIPLRDVAAAFCVERLIDLLALLVLAALIVSAFPHYDGVIWTAGGVSIACLALLVLLPWDTIARSLASSPRIPRALARVSAGAVNALAGARILLRPRTVFIGFLVALAAWGLEGLGLRVLVSIFTPPRVDTSLAIGIYGVAVLVGTLSFLPGGLGSTEAVMTALLAARGYSVAAALLVTLACRLVTLWFGVCLGWIAVVILRFRSGAVR